MFHADVRKDMKLIFAILGTHLRQKRRKEKSNKIRTKGGWKGHATPRDATPHCSELSSDGGGISVAIREQRPEQGAAYVQGERRY